MSVMKSKGFERWRLLLNISYCPGSERSCSLDESEQLTTQLRDPVLFVSLKTIGDNYCCNVGIERV